MLSFYKIVGAGEHSNGVVLVLAETPAKAIRLANGGTTINMWYLERNVQAVNGLLSADARANPRVVLRYELGDNE